MTQDTGEIKNKILAIIRRKGPSLPVHISGEIDMSILFTSAFLSELLSDKAIKISHMRVGGSPVYFISGQEPLLEKYIQYLKSKEKEAVTLLQEKKFLKDSEQEPAIRVALRSIKDFAMPFKKDEEIFWRYFKVSESEIKDMFEKEIEEEVEEDVEEEKEIEEIEKPKPKKRSVVKVKKKSLGGRGVPSRIGNGLTPREKPLLKLKEPKKKSRISKVNENFFDKIKEFLSEKNIPISDIVSFSRKDVILKIKDDEEKLLVAYNKKRITESDITKAYKKASELNLPYLILSLGEPTKKLNDFIKAIENLDSLETIK